ncbi:MAG: PD-(D/E)XK nuclease family protein [Gammaproteobacteria bacterium]|nr:PD-(D/E)XK nuclease family protein [Gammaproteobacteria bacterium]
MQDDKQDANDSPHAAPQVIWVPYADDPLRVLAQRICTTHRQQLPDLTKLIILLPELTPDARLLRELLAAARVCGCHALLGPTISTPRLWAAQHATQYAPEVSGYARELLLTEALVRYPHLYGKAHPWHLTDSLMRLFDELTLHQCELPLDLEAFHTRLARAYGMRADAPQALSREATLVHTLWQAWHEQLRTTNSVDSQSAYLLQLAHSTGAVRTAAHIYAAGFSNLCAAEIVWFRALSQRANCTVLLHGGGSILASDGDAHVPLRTLAAAFGNDAAVNTPLSACAEFLDAAFGAATPPIAGRARSFAARHPISQVKAHWFLFAARGAEQEARAIELQVRRWLLEGAQSVGIITENRRLARRVRALLERVGLAPDDLTGWALSTTRAASALERWLECVEEDFAHEPMLDVLKSAFVFSGLDRNEHLTAVYRLEEDIVRHENVARNLERYRHQLRRRRERLPGELGTDYGAVEALLDRLQNAAQPLTPLLGNRVRPAREYLHALHDSIARLGLTHAWRDDAAGARILQELELLRTAADTSTLRMNWLEFRAWLGRALERYNFIPPLAGSRVQMFNFAHSALARFDALVIAGCEQEFLPSTDLGSPFFNEGVRAELGLPTTQQQRNGMLHDFHRLLESAPRVLLTRVRDRDGEDVVASPWWDTLVTFHQLVYGSDLHDAELEALLGDPRAQVQGGDAAPLPEPTRTPRPRIDTALLPSTISAHSYQTLLNCPYQFFAAYGLKLKPPEAVREALQKDDYGKRVHLCLQAFHAKTQGLPAPFDATITAANRDAAIRHLESIARAVFAHDVDDDFRHRGWLKRWLAVVPAYIDWQIQRATQWTVDAVELKQQHPLEHAGLQLNGRIDRVDVNTQGAGIVDYKTGAVPRQHEIDAGEAVQLPFYASLLGGLPTVVSAEFVAIDTETVKTTAALGGNALYAMTAQNTERLITVMQQLRDGQAAPAWGDVNTCAVCDMEGLCRRPAWNDTAVRENQNDGK